MANRLVTPEEIESQRIRDEKLRQAQRKDNFITLIALVVFIYAAGWISDCLGMDGCSGDRRRKCEERNAQFNVNVNCD